MKKKRRALLADLRLKRKEMRKQQRELRKQMRQKRKELNKALRQRLKEMRKQRREFRKAFWQRKKCGYGCFPVEDDGSSSDKGGSEGSDSGSGDSSEGGSDSTDDDKKIVEIIKSKDPLKNLKKRCGKDVSVLSQFLRNKKNKKLKKFVLDTGSDKCGDECEDKATDVFGIWVNLIKQFKGICLKRRFAKISDCGLRKRKMKKVFTNLCGSYSVSLREALLNHYQYLIGGLGCKALNW
jgi:hypothetical protein